MATVHSFLHWIVTPEGSTSCLTVATFHLAHRSLPDEKKHWIAERARHTARVAAKVARNKRVDR